MKREPEVPTSELEKMAKEGQTTEQPLVEAVQPTEGQKEAKDEG